MRQSPGQETHEHAPRRDGLPRERAVPWSARDVMLALVTGFVIAGIVSVALLAALSAVVTLSRTAAFVLLGTLSYAALSAAVWWFCLKRHGAPWSAIGIRNPGLGAVAAMVPLSVGLLIANGILILALSLIFGDVDNPQQEALAPGGVLSTESFLLLFFLIALVAPIGEELVFRGMLYGLIRAHRGVALAVALSAALFAVAHVIPMLLPSLLLLGVALALIVERYSSIVPAIALHALNNGMSLALLYAASNRG